MKTEEIEARDRAETVYVGSVPMGGHNYPMEVVADEDGIMIDEALFVPWKWLENAKSVVNHPTHPSAV